MASGTLTPFISVFVALMVVGAVGNAGLLATVSGVGVAAGGLPKSRPLLLPDLIVLHLCLACLVHALSGGVSLVATSSVCCQDLPDAFCAAVNFLSRFAATMGGWFTLLLSLYRSAKLRSLERPSLAVTRLEAAAWPRRACGLLWVAFAIVFAPMIWSAVAPRGSSTTTTTSSSTSSSNSTSGGNMSASVACRLNTCPCVSADSALLQLYWTIINYALVWLPVVVMLMSNAQMICQLWRHRRAVSGESNSGAAGTGRIRACVQAAKVVLLTAGFYVTCKGAIGAGLAIAFLHSGIAAVPLTLVMSIAGGLFPALCPYLILAGDSRKRRALLAALRRAVPGRGKEDGGDEEEATNRD